jgi:hypothetical protein
MSEKESKPSPEVEKAEAAKIRVETERIQYELEQKKLIQPQEKQINLKKLEVQLQKLKHEEKRAKYEAGIAELSYNINKREEDKLLSSDRYNKIYRFVNAVSDASVADCMMVSLVGLVSIHLAIWKLSSVLRAEVLLTDSPSSISFKI